MLTSGSSNQMIPIGTRRILIVGGGLSGLVTAYRLHQAGLPVCLIEARSRLGGRILSAGEDNRPSNDGLDLGPSWFWPDMTPEILPLVDELGLTFVPQYTDGLMLFQRSQGGMPERYPSFRHQPSSMRLAGGTGAMVSALAARLPQDCLHLESRATNIARTQAGLIVTVSTASGVETIEATHVVFALPPRLLEATVEFSPPPRNVTRALWRATPTWMAPHAKFFAVYERPFWREAGLSGAAQSMAGPLVEIHDATTASGKAALFGFVGIPARSRMQLDEKALLSASIAQLGQIFGAEALHPVATLYKDWAIDTLTATELDLTAAGHPAGGRHDWVDVDWSRWITLSGSETAANSPGYLAGAIEAGERAAADLIRCNSDVIEPASQKGQ